MAARFCPSVNRDTPRRLKSLEGVFPRGFPPSHPSMCCPMDSSLASPTTGGVSRLLRRLPRLGTATAGCGFRIEKDTAEKPGAYAYADYHAQKMRWYSPQDKSRRYEQGAGTKRVDARGPARSRTRCIRSTTPCSLLACLTLQTYRAVIHLPG